MSIDPNKYDNNNIFRKIIDREIKSEILFETEYTLIFKDINPAANIHNLIIPKGRYVNFEDFSSNASDLEILDFFRVFGKFVSRGTYIDYNVVSNSGLGSGSAGLKKQEIPHFHVHFLAR